MRNEKNWRSPIVAGISIIFLAIVPTCTAQQNQPALQVTSPTAGTIVNPGQTITVSVASPDLLPEY